MLRFLYGSEKTNSYRPEPWAWSEVPFPALRGAGQRYNAFLAVAGGFTPWFSSFNLADNKAMSDDYCKVITTKKGTRLLVPCGKQDDEKILLITARGGFRGGFGKIEAVGAEILWQNSSSMHCCPVAHIIARVTEPDGYIRTETGRRCCSGCTEVYSWKGGYFGMDTEEYDAAVETGALFVAHDTIQSDLEECKAKRAEQAASRQARGEFMAQLEAINSRLEACGQAKFELGETFFMETGWGSSTTYHQYTAEEVAKAENKVVKAEADRAMREAEATWKPQFKVSLEGYTFPENRDSWGDSSLRFYSNCVSVRIKSDSKSYEYSEEGLAQFKSDIPAYEEEYQEILREKAEAEAKAKAKAEEEARRAQAEAEAKAKKEAAEAEAKELGLPSNIRLWHRDGATNAGEAWVIGPNGMERECDFVDTMVCGSNSKRYHQKYEGDHVWNQILPGELVLYWSHAYTAAPHKFEVIYKPETLTEAQLERVAEIQNGIEEQFFGKAGLASARSCPSIGQGWGLFHREEALGLADTEKDCDEQSNNGSGATLGQLFGDIFEKLNS